MADNVGRNPYKIIHVTLGGKEWRTAAFGANYTDYVAENLVLSTGENDQINFSASSKFNPVLDNIFKKLRNSTLGKIVTGAMEISQAAGGIVHGTGGISESQLLKELQILPPKARFQTTLAQLPAWESTGPMEIGSFKFKFYFGMAGEFDARKEVYNPAIALFNVNLPQKKGGFLFGPMPGPAYVYGEIAGSLLATMRTAAVNSSYDLETALSSILRSAEKGLEAQISGERGAVNLTWGRFQFPTFYVENTKVNFSKETDNNGYPIFAEVSWEGCKTLQVAHWGLLPFKKAGKDDATNLYGGLEYSTPESKDLDIAEVQAENRRAVLGAAQLAGEDAYFRQQGLGG